MKRYFSGVTAGVWALITAAGFVQANEVAFEAGAVDWHTDYQQAMQQAASQRRMLFIFFHDADKNPAREKFEANCLTPNLLAPWNSRYVWAKLPVNTRITSQGRDLHLLSHAAFGHLHGQQGIAILDFENSDPVLYGHVVSCFPFRSGNYYSVHSLKIILGLPRGTITQRTMIYAVRIHPEAPASTHGQLHPILSTEAQSHSYRQASMGVQGHHSWDSRFHRINARLSNGLSAQEVVAESWPNEDLVTACIDCVHSWRQSSGHWSAVRGRQRAFGYDIKRGVNGIWYATGIFAR